MLKIVNLCITDPSKEKFLFINRIKPPYINYWGMLGGKIKKEEEPSVAASRELLEESGIIGNGEFLGKCHEHIFEDGNLVYEFEIYFYHFATPCTEINHESREGELKWFDSIEFEKNKIIPSDVFMINNFMNKKMSKAISLVKKEKENYFQEKFEEVLNNGIS